MGFYVLFDVPELHDVHGPPYCEPMEAGIGGSCPCCTPYAIHQNHAIVPASLVHECEHDLSGRKFNCSQDLSQ